MVSVFFSYSHRDETLRDQLEIHLAALKRQGIIDTWHDRRILAGDEIAHKISHHLERADIILLLISPDFIASDYCYDIEMRRAMERHERGVARVIPVILRPCDWHGLPFGEILATPTDGKPVTKHPNQDEAFLDVTKAIRSAIADLGLAQEETLSDRPVRAQNPLNTRHPTAEIRSSNLRVKKTFSDRDRDRFVTQAFEFIAKYFEGSLKELEQRNPELETSFRRVDANHFSAAIYRAGTRASSCRIWIGGQRDMGGVAYSSSDTGNDSSYNEMLMLTDDGHSLMLEPLGMMRIGIRARGKLTLEGGAEYLWSTLIDPLQR